MSPITPAPTDIPDDDAENVSSATVENIVLSHSDTDSESENIDHDGYELLSQDPENFFSVENDEEDYNSTSDIEESITAEVNNLNTSSLLLSAPISSDTSFDDFASEILTMDEDHIETIKSVMKGITLPSSSLPQWATLVPEEEWKAALFSEMHARKSNDTISTKEIHSKQSVNNNEFDMPNDVLR